jgi:uncharacterized membrane protein YbjE (DUF340 family)
VLNDLMSAFVPMATLLGAIGAGAVVGGMRPALGPTAGAWMGRTTPVLVALQGVLVGSAPQVVAELPSLGGRALAVAVAAMAGSALLVRLFAAGRVLRAGATLHSHAAESAAHPLRATLVLATALVVGVALGIAAVWPAGPWIPTPQAMAWWGLVLLCALVGIDLGSSGLGRRVRETGVATLRVPVATVLGSLAGGLALWPLFGREALAAASGCGWYSLAGPMLTQSMGPEAGAVGFLANLLREVLSLLILPWLVGYGRVGGTLSVAIAGATAMDTSLPFLARYGGGDVALLGLVSGAVVTSAVPVLLVVFGA